jgi:GTPase SAR1 family protein
MTQILKLVVAGPKGSGKTTISNFLSGSKETLKIDKYDPTYGLRILEIDDVEIWDISGDQMYFVEVI